MKKGHEMIGEWTVAAFKNLQPEDMKVVMAAVHKELGIGGKTK